MDSEFPEGLRVHSTKKPVDHKSLTAVIEAKQRVVRALQKVRRIESDDTLTTDPNLATNRKRLIRELRDKNKKIISFLAGLESRNLKVLFSRIREIRNIVKGTPLILYASIGRYYNYMEALYGGEFRGIEVPSDKKRVDIFLAEDIRYPYSIDPVTGEKIPDKEDPEYLSYEAQFHFQNITRALIEYIEKTINEYSTRIEEVILPGIFDKDFADILRDMDRVRAGGTDIELSDANNPEVKLQKIIRKLEDTIESMRQELLDRIRYFEQHTEDRLLSQPTRYYTNSGHYKEFSSEDGPVSQFFK